MHIKSSFHPLFSISASQFIIFILFFHHSTQLRSPLTSSSTKKSTAEVQVFFNLHDILHGTWNKDTSHLKKSNSNIGSNFSESPEETTVGPTETPDVSDDLPDKTTELPVEITTQPNEATNGTSSTTVVPGVIDPVEDGDIYWYERPEGYITLAVIGSVTLIGIGSALVFICKNKLAIQAARNAMTTTPDA